MHFRHPDLRVLYSWDRLTFNVTHLQHLMREGVSTYQGSCIRSYLLVMTFFCTCVLLLITFFYTWVLLLFFFFILQTFFYTWVLLTPSLTYRPLAFIWPFFTHGPLLFIRLSLLHGPWTGFYSCCRQITDKLCIHDLYLNNLPSDLSHNGTR